MRASQRKPKQQTYQPIKCKSRINYSPHLHNKLLRSNASNHRTQSIANTGNIRWLTKPSSNVRWTSFCCRTTYRPKWPNWVWSSRHQRKSQNHLTNSLPGSSSLAHTSSLRQPDQWLHIGNCWIVTAEGLTNSCWFGMVSVIKTTCSTLLASGCMSISETTPATWSSSITTEEKA